MRSSGLALCLLALAAMVSAQSLAEVARKARERRQKLRKTGTVTRTVTDQDLASQKGRLANQPVPGDEEDEPGAKATASPSSRPASTPSATDTRRQTREDQEAYWRGQVAQARARIERAQRQYDSLNRSIRLGQPAMYNEEGRRVIYSTRQMKTMADQAQAELEAAKKDLEDLLEEARRAGALPGWLR